MTRGMSYKDVMELAAEKVDRLPIWAQNYIAALKREATNATRELHEIKNPPGDSNVFAVRGVRSDDQKLGKNVHIRFQLGAHDSIDFRMQRDEEGAFLNVNGDRRLSIEPRASNSIHVRLLEG